MSNNVRRTKNDKELLRKQIVDAASRAFTKSGIRSVRMDDIAFSLSMSKRTLYELFHDKEQLLMEVIRMHRQEMNEYIIEIASKADNALEVIFAFYRRKSKELYGLNPQFLRDLRKYPKVLEFIREEQRSSDAAALNHFNEGVKQGIFREDINFEIINQAMSMQLDLIIHSDLSENYPLSDIYREITFLHMRGITTEKGRKMVDAFLCDVREK
jgi:AcrR family transcriptional regulator